MGKTEIDGLRHRLYSVVEADFQDLALEIFRYQAAENAVYKEFTEELGIDPPTVNNWIDIPCIPVEVFKHREVYTGDWIPEAIFRSSGTGLAIRSSHRVRSLKFYHDLAIRAFEEHIGFLPGMPLLALLPNYVEQGDSSLVSMVAAFIERTNHPDSGFFLSEQETFLESIDRCKRSGTPYILWGVSYALLDLARTYRPSLGPHALVFETGGMKGRREELVRTQLHQALIEGFTVEKIYSEYGMTELLSQAYSTSDGLFRESATMRVMIREINDPLAPVAMAKPGAIHVIDLANLDTCSFVATADIGCMHPDHSFEVLGRIQNSDLRGCNLLYTEITY